jgi:hypothetical protein
MLPGGIRVGDPPGAGFLWWERGGVGILIGPRALGTAPSALGNTP